MTRSIEEQKIANSMFDKLRDDLLKRDLSNTENYDKAILTLSSSSLALSLTAIKFVVPIATASCIILLKSAWALLVLSVVCSLVAYLMSNKAMAVQLNNARDYYKNGLDDAFSRKNSYSTINLYLNLITGITFAIAVFLIVTFITINIESGEPTMSDKKGNSIYTEKSANTPSMERVPVGDSANVPTMEQAPSTTTTSDSGSSSGNK